MLQKRVWLWFLFLIAILASVWVFTAPFDRYLQFKQLQLWHAGYERIRVESPIGAFHYYLRGASHVHTPLILLHGLGSFAEYWAPFMKSLPEDRPVASMELLGFGRSIDPDVRPQDYAISLYLKQLAFLQEELQWRESVIVGVSLGGWIAAEYALDYPGRTRGLLLIAPGGLDSETPVEELAQLRRDFDFTTPEEYRKLINGRILTKPRWIPDFLAHIAIDRASRGGHSPILRNLKPEDWIGDRIAALTMPVALVWGKQDRVFPFQSAFRIRNHLPTVRLFPIENAGHSYLVEGREKTVEVLLKSLDWLLKEIDQKKGEAINEDSENPNPKNSSTLSPAAVNVKNISLIDNKWHGPRKYTLQNVEIGCFSAKELTLRAKSP